MAKERTVEEKAARKAEKKEKKRSETEGISKKSKKDKKEKKSKSAVDDDEADPATAVLNALENEKPGSVAVDKDGDVVVAMNGDNDKENKTTSKRPVGILVPFANPLADDKQVKRIFKAVKKANARKTLKRGVKEVNKSLRKSSSELPTSSSTSDPPAVVVIAGDASPMDVITHLPVLCEDHNVPYIYVSSRAALGEAGSTKRPTSVVMICRDRGNKKMEGSEEEVAEYKEVYGKLVEAVNDAAKNVTV